MTDVGPVTLADIRAARSALQGITRETPAVRSPSLTDICGTPVYLKLEHQQITGSFKLRGAANAVSRLTDDQRAKGVIGVSTGNHGRALAYSAKRAGVGCIICMSRLVPQNKVDAIRALGADVRIIGRSQDEAQAEVDRLVETQGMTMLPPFGHADIIAGQGTLGLEIRQQAPDVTTVLVQLSGGGLISGVAAALKAQRPDIRVVGVSMARGAAMHASLAAGLIAARRNFAELGDICAGKAKGRTSPDQITIADLTGTGVQDTAIATFARQRAAAAGIGTDFNN